MSVDGGGTAGLVGDFGGTQAWRLLGCEKTNTSQ